MIEYLLIFILSIIFSIVWEWTKDKHKRIWYLYAGITIVISIVFISTAIFNSQSPYREILTSWEGILLIVSSSVGWRIGEKIYHYKEN